jgi:hypothetical protein
LKKGVKFVFKSDMDGQKPNSPLDPLHGTKNANKWKIIGKDHAIN